MISKPARFTSIACLFLYVSRFPGNLSNKVLDTFSKLESQTHNNSNEFLMHVDNTRRPAHIFHCLMFVGLVNPQQI